MDPFPCTRIGELHRSGSERGYRAEPSGAETVPMSMHGPVGIGVSYRWGQSSATAVKRNTTKPLV